MRRGVTILTACLILALSAVPVTAAGNANVTIGARQLQDDDTWDAADTPPMFGVSVDFGPESWPVSLAVEYTFSYTKEDVRLEAGSSGAPQLLRGEATAVVADIGAGVRKTWRAGATRPFVEGGLAVVIAGLDVDNVDDSDINAGAYVQAGVYWRLGPVLNLGFNARALLGSKIDLSDGFGDRLDDGTADYVSAGLVLGGGWPSE